MQTFDPFLQRVGEILEKARQNVKTAVNLSMVYAYYEKNPDLHTVLKSLVL